MRLSLRRWTAHEMRFLREWYPLMGSILLTKALQRSECSVKRQAISHGIKLLPYAKSRILSAAFTGRHRTTWTSDRLAILHQHYPTHGAKKVSELTGLSIFQVYDGAKHYDVKWSIEARAQHINNTLGRALAAAHAPDAVRKARATAKANRLARGGMTTKEKESRKQVGIRMRGRVVPLATRVKQSESLRCSEKFAAHLKRLHASPEYYAKARTTRQRNRLLKMRSELNHLQNHLESICQPT